MTHFDMIDSSSSNDSVPESCPRTSKSDVPKGLERYFPFFLDLQTPLESGPAIALNTTLCEVSTVEDPVPKNEQDLDVAGLLMRAKIKLSRSKPPPGTHGQDSSPSLHF